MTKGIVICKLWKRKGKPSVNAEKLGRYYSGDEVEILDVVLGETENDYYEGTPTWYKLTGGIYVWSGGVSLAPNNAFLLRKVEIDKKRAKEDKSAKSKEKESNKKNYIIIPVEDFQGVINKESNNGIMDYSSLLNIQDCHYGNDTLIAIFDQGIQKTHEAIKNKFDSPVYDENIYSSHGTSVASLCAGNSNRLKGVAYLAEIYDANFYSLAGFISKSLKTHLDYLNELRNEKPTLYKAVIANFSFNLKCHDYKHVKSQIEISSKNILIVASAGENEQLLKKELQNPASHKNVISVGVVRSGFDPNGIDFNENLDLIVPDFRYVTAEIESNETYGSISSDSAACAIVSGMISSCISSGELDPNPSYADVLKYLRQVLPSYKQSINTDQFQIYTT